MSTAFVGLEGYTLPTGFILKELCIIYPNSEFDHYLFKMPNWYLTEGAQRTIRYTTQVLNNLSYMDGKVPYEEISNVLDPIKDTIIYTYSDIAVSFLQRYLPTTVVKNVQSDGFKMPNILPDSNCFRTHCPRYCAKSKAIAVKEYAENFTGYV